MEPFHLVLTGCCFADMEANGACALEVAFEAEVAMVHVGCAIGLQAENSDTTNPDVSDSNSSIMSHSADLANPGAQSGHENFC